MKRINYCTLCLVNGHRKKAVSKAISLCETHYFNKEK